jgi:hypothetical protein
MYSEVMKSTARRKFVLGFLFIVLLALSMIK